MPKDEYAAASEKIDTTLTLGGWLRKQEDLYNSWPIITPGTHIQKIHQIHKDIWDYVLEHGEKPFTPYLHNCVLCEYTRVINGTSAACCRDCPAIWTETDPYCLALGSPYRLWERFHEARLLVRNIPFKYEKEKTNEQV